MRGIRFSVLVALPFILATTYILYMMIFREKEDWITFVIPFLAILVILYILHPQIDFWYDKRYPPKLDPPIIAWLQTYFPFYQSLEKEKKEKFEERLALYLNAREFNLMLKSKERIPEDFKAIIAAHGIQMGIGLDDYLIGNYDRIICYNHPFPTPKNRFLHTVEVHHVDGVILLSIEQLMAAIGKPKEFYNLAYHAYAEAFLHLNENWNNITDEDFAWSRLENILPYTKNHIQKYTGFEILDINIVCLAAFFINNTAFETKWPEQYRFYKKSLNYVS